MQVVRPSLLDRGATQVTKGEADPASGSAIVFVILGVFMLIIGLLVSADSHEHRGTSPHSHIACLVSPMRPHV